MTPQKVATGMVERRRDTIKSFAAQSGEPLPSSLGMDPFVKLEQEKVISPLQRMNQDIARLEDQKKQHLAIPHHKGGKKMNRLSYIGLFLGFAIAGTLFFIAGFVMCYSLYPPYGGLMFQPQYADTPAGSPLVLKELDKDSLIPAQIPPRSYAERQAYLAKSSRRSSEKGLFEQAEQRTIENVKNQVRDSVREGTRSFAHRWAGRLGSTLSRVLNPVLEVPIQASDQAVSEALNVKSDPSQNKISAPAVKADPSVKPSLKKFLDVETQKKESLFRVLPSHASSSTENSSESASSSFYGLRVHAFKDKESALKLAEELKRKGHQGYVVPLWRANHLEFQVRVGLYRDFAQARTAAKILRDQGLVLTNVIIADAAEEHLQP